MQNAFDQVIPNYYGWALKKMTRVKEKVEKKVEVNLPSMKVKITQFETIKKYFHGVTSLLNSANVIHEYILRHWSRYECM